MQEPASQGAHLRFDRGPLVGRAQEFEALVESYHRAAGGAPRAVVVTGETGIGKTRLVADFLAWAEAQGAGVLQGRSFESGRRLPYQPDEATARMRLFESVARLTLSLAERTAAGAPLLIFIDDLQWAGSASLDLLHYAARRWQESDSSILLLVTARSEALHPLAVAQEPGPASWLQGLERHLPATTHSLQPLTAGDTAQFIAAFGAGEHAALARWLFDETDGQPFYLVETLEDLRERDLLKASVDEEGGWRPQSLERERAPGSQPGSCLTGYGRSSPVVWPASARRRLFHHCALAALTDEKAPADRLAYHVRAAGDREAVFRHGVTAGDEALALFAARAAIGHYEQARSARGDELAAAGDPLRRLYLNLGRAYELVGEHEAALATYDALQVLAREQNSNRLELAALMARTTVYAVPTQHYDPENVAILTQQALPLARELGDRAAEAKIQWNLMLLKLFTGDLGEAVAAGEASLALARKHGLRERLAYALHDLTCAYLFSGRPEKGLAAGAEAEQLWRELDNKAMLADNLVSTASARHFWKGAQTGLIPQLEEALALSEKIDNLWNRSYANHILAAVYYDLGHFSQALAACERAVELGVRAGFLIPLYTNASIMAWIYGLVGRPELGFPWVERALAAETGIKDQQAGPLAVKAYLHLCRGELEQADEAIERSYDRLQLESLSAGTFFTFPIDGRLRLAQEDFRQALAVGKQFVDHLEKTKFRPFRADALYIRGRALMALERTDEAQKALAAARAEAEALNTRRILWEILAAQARVAERQGRSETAVSRYRQAGNIVEYIAAHIDEPELRDSFLARPAVGVVRQVR